MLVKGPLSSCYKNIENCEICSFRHFSFLIPSNVNGISEDILLKMSGEIKTLNRSDFIAKFLGHTSIKTNKLLTENLGNILIIKNMHPFNKNDTFCQEAIETIKRFIYENSDKIIIIFDNRR